MRGFLFARVKVPKSDASAIPGCEASRDDFMLRQV
jgi:hypothetical protein